MEQAIDLKPILHVVRRYGPVGGMERYVWELTRNLVEIGCEVHVLCESMHVSQPPAKIAVHVLPASREKPRWLSLLQFSTKVQRWLRRHCFKFIVHSHERIDGHQITTFHAPPFALIYNRPWWQRLSLRVLMQLWMEQREVCGDHVRYVVPNSGLIRDMLSAYYPCIGKRLTPPIPPGVGKIPIRKRRCAPLLGGVMAFVGEEWRRKGLDIAAKVYKQLRKKRPKLEFWVIGPEPESIRHLFDSTTGVRLLGRRDALPLYEQFDLLIHPARMEPYGMVIAEALAAGVPVALSNRCGIADEIVEACAEVVDVDAPIPHWADVCERLLAMKARSHRLRSWRSVAASYLELYRKIQSEP